MIARVCFLLVFFVALPSWSQVEPSASGGATTTEDDSQMMTPPPVSGLPYPNTSAAESRSNYLNAAITGNVAYIDNVLPGEFLQPVSDTAFSIDPTLSLARYTSRQQATLSYSPNFTFYEPTSSLNTLDQNASGIFQDRLSPHVTISLQDFFMRTHNVFNESFPFSQGGLTGSTEAPIPAIIAPFAEEMTDTASANIGYQFGRNSMIGGGGTYSNLDFPNPSEALGLSNSSGEGATAFYSRRLTRMQYFGAAYEYGRNTGNIPYGPFVVQVHTGFPFYTIYFNREFSLSLSAGLQRTFVTASSAPETTSFSPSGVASMGWRGNRGNFAVSYLHTVTSGQGLYGGFHSDSANANGGLTLSRTWSMAIGASYANISPVSSAVGVEATQGNTFTAQATLSHALGEHLTAQCGYERLEENYTGVTVVSENPSSDREFVTVTYNFKKPLGR